MLFSGGWCFLVLGSFYLVLDLWKRKSWAFPLVVVGMNSIAAYMIAHLFEHFIRGALLRHFGQSWYAFAGKAYAPLLLGLAILLCEWLILFYLYKRKVFIRI